MTVWKYQEHSSSKKKCTDAALLITPGGILMILISLKVFDTLFTVFMLAFALTNIYNSASPGKVH